VHGPGFVGEVIFNTDQGNHFTSIALIQVLKDAQIAISMDGKGAWRDNVFVKKAVANHQI
jgi:putative transposase